MPTWPSQWPAATTEETEEPHPEVKIEKGESGRKEGTESDKVDETCFIPPPPAEA